MIDLHVHVLPGVDDGPATLEDAVALAQAAEAAGTGTLVVTPHIDHRYGVAPARVPEAVAELASELAHRGLNVRLAPGGEISLARLVEMTEEERHAVALGGGPWLLVESPHGPAPFMDRILFEQHARGARMILAHTERCPAFQRDPERLRALVELGMLSSITAGSLAGRFGNTARRAALRLLREGLVHNVASDAHDLRRRTPDLQAGFAEAERYLPGLERQADWLTLEAPAAILAGETLPPAPPLRPTPRRRGWQKASGEAGGRIEVEGNVLGDREDTAGLHHSEAARPGAQAAGAVAERGLDDRPRRRITAFAPATALLVGGALFAIAFNGGTYAADQRDALAIAIWSALLLFTVLRLWPRERLPQPAVITGGLLLAFATWTGLSALWAPAAETALTELGRVLLLTGLFALAVLASRAGQADRWCDGLALGIAGIALVALASRLFPDLGGSREIGRLLPGIDIRLSHPLDYWNGLAIFVALGVPLLLRAATAERAMGWRALALAPLPIIGAVIYLTSSRGGAAVVATGLLAFLALTRRRLLTLWATLVAGAGAAEAIVVLHERSALVEGPFRSAAAYSQGRGAALLVALTCVGVVLVYGGGARLAPRNLRLPRELRIAGVVAGLALLGGSVALADPAERLDRFREVPAQGGSTKGYVESHLLSGGGSSRWQFWSSALDQFQARPGIGRGAGTFEAWWAQNGDVFYFVRDAHSLWLETLGELGLVGAFLLVAAFGWGLATGLQRLRGRSRDGQAATAALIATLAAFMVGAAIDWMWELTAVASAGMLCLGLLVGPATLRRIGREGSGRRPDWPLPALAVLAALALGVIALQAFALLSEEELRGSEAAAARTDTDGAIEDALRARALQPWSSRPPLQLALVEEQAGELPSSRDWIEEALDRNPSDWRLWLVAARIQTKVGDARSGLASLRRARAMNSRSTLLKRP